jgi:flavin-binding protein dodecin
MASPLWSRRIDRSKEIPYEESSMAVAKIIEMAATSDQSFEDGIAQGIGKAAERVQNIKGTWVKEQKVLVENGSVNGHRVDFKVSFVLN